MEISTVVLTVFLLIGQATAAEVRKDGFDAGRPGSARCIEKY
jgi:hypothetical protein